MMYMYYVFSLQLDFPVFVFVFELLLFIANILLIALSADYFILYLNQIFRVTFSSSRLIYLLNARFLFTYSFCHISVHDCIGMYTFSKLQIYLCMFFYKKKERP